MCNPMIIGAIGAGIMAREQYATSKAKDKQLGLIKKRDSKLSDKAMDTIRKNLSQYDPNQRQTNLGEKRAESENTLLDVVGKSHDAGKQYFGDTPGRVSDVYTDTKNQRFDANKGVAEDYARLTSRYRAPFDMRFDESLNDANYAQQIYNLNQTRKRLFDAGMLGYEGIKPDTTRMALGSALMAYGGGM